jgi:hypothetical protein
MPPLHRRIYRRLASMQRTSHANFSGTFEPVPIIGDRPFALFLLQKQPESSVDVIGSPFTNQFEVIRALARLLPFGWEIWVKEHPNATGDRSVADYRDLKRIPGLRLIDPFSDTHGLLRRAALTASISGTACLEAGLLGAPAITIAEMFFGKLLVRNGLDAFHTTRAEFVKVLDEAAALRGNSAPSGIEDHLSWIVAQSFPGVISDPANVPSVMETENVDNVADATLTLMRHLSR